jgi:hypothetical protein
MRSNKAAFLFLGIFTSLFIDSGVAEILQYRRRRLHASPMAYLLGLGSLLLLRPHRKMAGPARASA